MKTCARCGLQKPVQAFPSNPKMTGGLDSWCRDCRREYMRAYSRAHYVPKPKVPRPKQPKKPYVSRAKPKPEATCLDCGSAFASHHIGVKVRCDLCQKRREYQRSLQSATQANARRLALDVRTCEMCGSAFSRATGRKTFCSAECCIRFHRDLARHRRRTLDHGGAVERVVRNSVFERDNWRCALCGESISPTAPRRTAWSASLDHIIPVARGGDHSLTNLQAAHLVCNIRKGARAA